SKHAIPFICVPGFVAHAATPRKMSSHDAVPAACTHASRDAAVALVPLSMKVEGHVTLERSTHLSWLGHLKANKAGTQVSSFEQTASAASAHACSGLASLAESLLPPQAKIVVAIPSATPRKIRMHPC